MPGTGGCAGQAGSRCSHHGNIHRSRGGPGLEIGQSQKGQAPNPGCGHKQDGHRRLGALGQVHLVCLVAHSSFKIIEFQKAVQVSGGNQEMHPRWAHDATRKTVGSGNAARSPCWPQSPAFPIAHPQNTRLACVLTPSIWALASALQDLEGVPRAGEAERVWAQGPSQVA